jgi:hypothetical protein
MATNTRSWTSGPPNPYQAQGPDRGGLQQYLRWWLEHGFRDACAYAEKTDYLFPGENTEQLGERTVQEFVHEAAKAAGIPEVIFRDTKGRKKHRITPYSFS